LMLSRGMLQISAIIAATVSNVEDVGHPSPSLSRHMSKDNGNF